MNMPHNKNKNVLLRFLQVQVSRQHSQSFGLIS